MCQFLNPAKNRLYPFLNMLSCHPFPATPHISASFWDVELFPFTLLSSRASRAVFWGFGFLWVLGIGQGPLAHTSHLSCSLTTLTLTLLHIDVCLLPFATNSTRFVCVCVRHSSPLIECPALSHILSFNFVVARLLYFLWRKIKFSPPNEISFMNFLLFLYLIGHHNKVTSKTLFNLTTGVKIEEYPATCAKEKKDKSNKWK